MTPFFSCFRPFSRRFCENTLYEEFGEEGVKQQLDDEKAQAEAEEARQAEMLAAREMQMEAQKEAEFLSQMQAEEDKVKKAEEEEMLRKMEQRRIEKEVEADAKMKVIQEREAAGLDTEDLYAEMEDMEDEVEIIPERVEPKQEIRVERPRFAKPQLIRAYSALNLIYFEKLEKPRKNPQKPKKCTKIGVLTIFL